MKEQHTQKKINTPDTSNTVTQTLPTEPIRYQNYRGEVELIGAFDLLIDFISKNNPRPESDLGKVLKRAKELSAKSKSLGSEPNLNQQEVLEVINTLEEFKKNPTDKLNGLKDKKPNITPRMTAVIDAIAAIAGATKRKE
jgi:hypothetical protein